MRWSLVRASLFAVAVVVWMACAYYVVVHGATRLDDERPPRVVVTPIKCGTSLLMGAP